MKGPSGRITYQAKRMWHCPKCQRQVLTGGNVTTQACVCQPGETVWMHVAGEHCSPRDLSSPPTPHAS